MKPAPTTLAEIEAAIWKELALAVRDKAHAWRTPVLATVRTGEQGPEADARTVVLREVDAGTRTLLFFTDARSPKAAQMAACPAGTLVLWSAALGWQLRIRAQLQLQTEGLAVMSRWARVKLSPAAQDYVSPLPPGSPLGSLPGSPLDAAAPAIEPARESREHFAVIAAGVQSMDWLELGGPGHRRAEFKDPDQARWLTP